MKQFQDEKELIQAIKAGDDHAFACFYSEYSRKIRILLLFLGATPDEADDLVQDTFAKLLEIAGGLDENLSIRSYARRIARNLFLDHIRKVNVRSRFTKNPPPEETSIDPFEALSAKELKGVLSEAVTRLPADKQLIFTMSRMEGLTYPEIAHNLKTTPKAVERQMARSLEMIRKYIARRITLYIKIALLFLTNHLQ